MSCTFVQSKSLPCKGNAVSRLAAPSRPTLATRRTRRVTPIKALLGQQGGSPSDKKTLKREEEPEEYWSSASERDGANPMKDPLAIMGLVAIFFPFIFLGIAVATGVVDLSVYR